jgi:divalent metal cation (Fe/Co/Zn/Cd) transporter
MHKAIYFALLAVGLMLLAVGLNATESFTSELSRVLTGTPTDKALWMLVCGVIAAVIGVVGLLDHRK